MEFLRDQLMSGTIFSLFSFCWFGWAQEKPRPNWRLGLGLASSAALLLSIFSGVLSYYNWDAPSILNNATHFGWYLLFAIGEFIVALIGALILIKLKRSDDIAPWISFIVLTHFIGLKFVFQDSSLFVLAGLMLLVLLLSYPLAARFKVARSAIIGIGNGTVLFLFAIINLSLAFIFEH
ncbi:hypothetical protein [Liquorilactobacillus capillatus]|uniref:Integral membrane protein n=1 Tax=Liquorilactobacillus capillatus DSM 19910 TaxID=1423731 RepID=A0A0R1M7V0_9LACO|nr:hypothetical protein [Liquorilactobacillus capillatus]KRL01125.1 hypothetical protein FC81_GL001264 [Liquorilactobacillus capillatus DSM 19910]